MKYAKVLCLVAALASVMAFASTGSASATELTCGPAICPAGTVIHGVSEGHIIFENTFIGEIKCRSTIQAKTVNVGGAAETVRATVEEHLYFECTEGAVAHTIRNGEFEIHTQNEPINNFNGTVTSSGTEVTLEVLGLHCIISTSNTHLGTITGSANTGGTATWDLEGTLIPRTGGRSGAFCGSTVRITGSYLIDQPMVLNVD